MAVEAGGQTGGVTLPDALDNAVLSELIQYGVHLVLIGAEAGLKMERWLVMCKGHLDSPWYL